MKQLLHRLLRSARRGWAAIRLAFDVLLPCRFGILVLVLVTVTLAFVDQGLESLRVLAEFGDRNQVGAREPYLFRLLLFLLGTSALASSAWFFSRQALLLEPPRPPVSRLAERLFLWAPRALGVLGFACPALALWLAADQYPVSRNVDQVPAPGTTLRLLSVVFLLLAALFGIFVTKRRALFRLELLAVPAGPQRARELPATTRRVLWASGLTTAVLFVWILVDPIALTAVVATPSVILFCAAIWVVVGTVLVVLAARIRLPLFTLLFVLLLVSSRTNDTHRVRPLGPARWRPELNQAATSWIGWLDRHYETEARHPVFVVAAEGGGLRAAYWTAAVLTSLQHQYQTFADHCFAISAVSGGSLGAAVFATLLSARPDDFRVASREVLSHDYLAPTIARLLGTDLPQQFLPFPILPDRGSAMEKSWEESWKNVSEDALSRPFLELGLPHRPLLFLNGTEVETGRRVIFSPVRIPPHGDFQNAEDGIDLVGGDLPTSAAAHLSARFTYVSPAGTLRSGGAVHRIVDGGYYENSGAATASEIVRFLKWGLRGTGARIDLHVIVIQHYEKTAPSGEILSEELSPLRAIFATRIARGEHAVEDLHDVAGDGAISVFDLASSADIPLPLGWLLSAQARRAIDADLESKENREARAEVGALLTGESPQAERNTKPDDLAHLARKQQKPTTLKDAVRQIVKAR